MYKLSTGGSEQVKQVKQLLHRKSEAESAKNLANWQIYPVFFLAASPEILMFLPPCKYGVSGIRSHSKIWIKGILNKDVLHFLIFWHQIWWFFKIKYFITESAAVEFWKIIQYDQKISLQHISPWWFQNQKTDVWVHTRILKIHHYY